MITVFYYMALLGTLMSGMLLLPALLAFGVGENDEGLELVIYAILGGFISFSVLLAGKGRIKNLGRIGTINLVVFGWIIFPLIIAIPFGDVFNISYADAVFEAVSAFTTTAADGVINIDAEPRSAIWLRSQTQWLGGLATLATFVLFLGPIRIGGLPQSTSGIREGVGIDTNTIGRRLSGLSQAYLGFTLLCFITLLLCGMQPFSSMMLASAAVSTGGYLPSSEQIIDVAGASGMFALAVFLLIGASSALWMHMIWRRDWEGVKKHRETYTLFAIVFVLTIMFVLSLIGSVINGSPEAIQLVIAESFFNAASLTATSGLESRPGVFALLSPILVFCIVIIGACAYSTGGGIKLFRIGAMLSHASIELSRLIYPHAMGQSRFGNRIFGPNTMRSIWTMFCAALFVISVSSMLLSLTGMGFDASLMASAAAFSNAGPVYSPVWVERGVEGWPAYADMLSSQKTILAITMIFGRLEIIAVIAALNPAHWFAR